MTVPGWRKMGGELVRACLLGIALLMVLPAAVCALTPSGTVISHGFSARFATPSPRQVHSNQTQITVRDLADPELVPPRSATAQAGVPVDFQHVLTNRGNFPDSFQLKVVPLQGVTESAPAPLLRFYQGDGVTPVPANPEGVQVVGPVAAGASVNLVLRAVPAAGSEGRVTGIVLSATSVLFPARSSSVSDQLQVPVPGSVTVLKGSPPRARCSREPSSPTASRSVTAGPPLFQGCCFWTRWTNSSSTSPGAPCSRRDWLGR
ncbi:hypothetical protein [Geomonas subterranea]|uniref:hypothetical protein n=1 Tax=Geomonas subterranea TaxID=2847989 RepID=UPI003F5AB808